MKLIFIFAAMISSVFAQVHMGKIAPSFTLKGHDGKTYSLEEQKGKIVVLEWYNPGCPFVRKHYDPKNMQTLQKEFKDKVVWFSINSSAAGKQGHLTQDLAKDKYNEEGMHATAILLDGENGQVGKLYEAVTTPHVFIINKKGELVYNGAIDSIASANSDDIKKAEPLAQNAIKAALAGTKIAAAKNKPYGCGVKY